MSDLRIRPRLGASSFVILGYLTASLTLPFLLSYKETLKNDVGVKGTIHARALFNKI